MGQQHFFFRRVHVLRFRKKCVDSCAVKLCLVCTLVLEYQMSKSELSSQIYVHFMEM